MVNSTNIALKKTYNGKEFNDELGLNWHDFGARNYDASLGRWMNLDPLAHQYSNVTPYAFVANMPTIATDPDGKRIIIGGNKKYRNEILLGLLKMASTKKGLALFKKMANSKDNVVISHFKGEDKNSTTSYQNEDGTMNHFVNINLGESKGKTEDGAEKTVETSLGHELGHASDTMDGKNDGTLVSTSEAAAKGRATKAYELDNMHSDNLIRAGLGYTLRKTHSGVRTMNMQISTSNTWLTVDDYQQALQLEPKASDMYFDYNSVPRATLSNAWNALKVMFNSGSSTTSGLKSFENSRFKFKETTKKAVIIDSNNK